MLTVVLIYILILVFFEFNLMNTLESNTVAFSILKL